MPIEQDTQEFCKWAIKLGCPPDSLPSNEAIKSILKSRQSDLIYTLMKRVQPRQIVQEVRENVLIKEMKQYKTLQVVSLAKHKYLPEEMQTFLKVKELLKRKRDTDLRLKEFNREYDTLAESLKIKSAKRINLSHTIKTIKTRIHILEFKLESLEKQIKEEEQNKLKILAIMPVRMTSKNCDENVAMSAIKKALQELDGFYKFCYCNDKNSTIAQNIVDVKNKLWDKMRSTFSNIPNYLIFNCIMRLKEEQLQNVTQLNKENLEKSDNLLSLKSSSNYGGSCKDTAMPPFEVKLLKMKAELLGLVAKYLKAQKENSEIEKDFAAAYIPFVDELQKKIMYFNSDKDEDEIVEVLSEFIIQLNTCNSNHAQNAFLTQQIEILKAEIEIDNKHLENHELLLGSVKQVYNDINDGVNRIQNDMLQLGQIKEKILYSKNLIKHMFEDGSLTTNASYVCSSASAASVTKRSTFKPMKIKMNDLTASGVCDSFEMGGDDVFCSTKLDFDVTSATTSSASSSTSIRRGINTTIIGLGVGQVNTITSLKPGAMGGNIEMANRLFISPPHALELSVFGETPLDHFSCMPKVCSNYLQPNPLIIESSEISSSIFQLAPGITLTAFGALQEVRNQIVWFNTIAEYSNDLNLNLSLAQVDINALKQQRRKHHEEVSELLDKIEIDCVNSKRLLEKNKKLFNFIVENPLRHFIPSRKTFNNLTYADYEGEFEMYYRMGTMGQTFRKKLK